jgi:ribosomal protein S27AE
MGKKIDTPVLKCPECESTRVVPAHKSGYRCLKCGIYFSAIGFKKKGEKNAAA